MSDDNPSSRNLANVLSFIDQVAALGEHYEHYDYHMGGDGRNASSGRRGYYGDFIPGPGDWSTEAVRDWHVDVATTIVEAYQPPNTQ